MKKILISIVILFCSISTYSQSYYGKGDAKINAGFDIYGYGSGIKVFLDYGLSDIFSIGTGASYYLSNDDTDYYIFGRTAVHLGELLDLNERLDIYPGFELGYLERNDVGFTAFLGVRYFFTD
ncbi:MAG: DUF6646 family protein, partial [Bacteroidota bacterium]